MKYKLVAHSDIGIVRKVNQDSLLIKKAMYKEKEVVLAVVCDGMGGLSKGELASAEVIQQFSKWFDEQLKYYLEPLNIADIAQAWVDLISLLNTKISEYGKSVGISMGTTFTGVLFVDSDYLIGHVGDSRLYRIDPDFEQLTTDQTFVYREYLRGNISFEEIETHPKKNVLLQCIGASPRVNPEMIQGSIDTNAVFMLCSDGFRHVLKVKELQSILSYDVLKDEQDMEDRVKYLVEVVKQRRESDNISVILIQAKK